MIVSPGTMVCVAANTGAVSRAAETTNQTPATEATISRMPRKNRASPQGARRGARAGAAAVMPTIVAHGATPRRRRYPQRVVSPGDRLWSRVHNGVMPEIPTVRRAPAGPAQVAEILGVSVDEVMDLVTEGQLRGIRVGSPARWRIDEASVADYLDDQAERHATHGAVASVEQRELPRAVGHRVGAQRRLRHTPASEARETAAASDAGRAVERGSTPARRTARCGDR